MRGRFRCCYPRSLDLNPTLAGSVNLVARIGAAGNVTRVSGGGELAAIVPCLKQIVMSAIFTAPSGGGAALVIPITFVTSLRNHASD